MERKKLYHNVMIKRYKDLEENLTKIVTIDRDTSLDDALVQLEEVQGLNEQNVWILYGKNGEGELQCLQVGQSINIEKEIKTNIKLMFKDYLIDEVKSVAKHTQFYRNAFELPKGIKKRPFLYSMMNKVYTELYFYVVDLDRYIEASEKINQEIFRNGPYKEEDKKLFVEASIARETQSLYWNTFRGGLDAKFLKLLNEKS